MIYSDDIIKINQFDFAGTIQKNRGKYLEAAITWHFDDFDGDVSNLDEQELKMDARHIVDAAFGVDFGQVEMPDGKKWFRDELEESVLEKIDEIYS